MVIKDSQFNLPRDMVARFEDFLRLSETDGIFPYLQVINALASDISGKKTLDVDFNHIIIFHDEVDENYNGVGDPLAKEIWDNPGPGNPDNLKKCDQALVNVLHEESNGTIKFTDTGYHVRFFNLPEIRHFKIRHITSKQCYKLISTFGVIVEKSDTKEQMRAISFECRICGAQHDVDQVYGDKLTYPAICNVGGCKNSKKDDFRVLGEISNFVDCVLIRIQENSDDSEVRASPKAIDVVLLEDLAEESVKLEPGDHVRIVGYVELLNLGKESIEKQRFGRLMHANSIVHEDKNDSKIEIPLETENKIKELAKRPDIFDLIERSFAPGFHGLQMVKKGLILSLFSRKRIKTTIDGDIRRGYIHAGLFGDPSTGKTRLLKWLRKLVNPAIDGTAALTTKAGLAGGLVQRGKDGFVFTPGAMVHAFNGILTLDEMNVLDESILLMLNDAIENQHIPFNKVGVNTDIKTEFSFICAANPKEGRWDTYLTPVQNLNYLPPQFMSRLDLMFVIRDIPNEEADDHISDNIVSMFMRPDEIKAETRARITPPLDIELLRQYIYYMHENIEDVYISEEVHDYICDYYKKLRKQSDKGEGVIQIDARTLETLIRLSLARARMSYREDVIKSDVEEVMKVFEASLKQTTWDETSQSFNVDQVQLGKNHEQTLHEKYVYKIIDQLQKEGKGQPVSIEDVNERARFIPYSMKAEEVSNVIDNLKKEAMIVEKKNGKFLVVKDASGK